MYSNDASLLLPTSALGQRYRVLGWNAGHPVPVNFPRLGTISDRSYVTIVGVSKDTRVSVTPSWRIRGGGPIAATEAGGEIVVMLAPFDVLNLETDDGVTGDDPRLIADLSGTGVQADKPVAVFTGVESAGVPYAWKIPTHPGWTDENGGGTCCLDHLEEQLFPVEALGTKYVVTRSPIRSITGFREPDILRFVGSAEDATVTTNLPTPWDSFTLAPGEVKTTWTQDDIVVQATKPIAVAQLLIGRGYAEGPEDLELGDPSLTVFSPIEQFRDEMVISAPEGWSNNWVVIAEEVGSTVLIDEQAPTDCVVEPAGTLDARAYEARRCRLFTDGLHRISGDRPFGVIAYGYAKSSSYAVVGAANAARIYAPPPP